MIIINNVLLKYIVYVIKYWLFSTLSLKTHLPLNLIFNFDAPQDYDTGYHTDKLLCPFELIFLTSVTFSSMKLNPARVMLRGLNS